MTRVDERFLEEITILTKDSASNVDANSATLSNLADPQNAQDIVTKFFLENYSLQGDVTGTIDNNKIVKITFGGESLSLGQVEDGYFLIREDGYIIGSTLNNLVFNLLTVNVAKSSTGTILANQPIRITNYIGGVIRVEEALSNSSTTMPAFAVSNEEISDISFGKATFIGFSKNINTDGYSLNDVVYVDPSGDLSITRPENPDEIVQFIGLVTEVGENGTVFIIPTKIEDIPNRLNLTSKEVVNQETTTRSWMTSSIARIENTDGYATGLSVTIDEGVDAKISFYAFAVDYDTKIPVYRRNITIQGFRPTSGNFALYSDSPADTDGVNTYLSTPVGVSTTINIESTGASFDYIGNEIDFLSWVLFVLVEYTQVEIYDFNFIINNLQPELWLDTDLNYITIDEANPATGDQVSNWLNKSSYGNPHDFYQTLDARQPTISIVDEINCLYFSGAPQYLESAGTETWETGTDHSMFFIFRPDISQNAVLFDSTSGRIIIRITSDDKILITSGADRTTIESPILIEQWQWLFLEFDTTGSVTRLWHNGVALTDLTYNARNISGICRVGFTVSGSLPFIGYISEVWIKTGSLLSDDEKAQLSRAINIKYGLARGSLV